VTFAVVDGRELALDAYRPLSAAGGPAVIVVHGGGWTSGDKGDLPQWSAWLVHEGFAVFDIQYRLAPPPTWTTAPGDVKCAIGWVKQNAEQFGVDPDRIALLGRSAGAHLALLAAYSIGHNQLPPSCQTSDTSVRAVIELYGPTDLLQALDHPAAYSLFDGETQLSSFVGGDVRSAWDRLALASPTMHVGPRTPPTLLVHGGRDQFVHPDQLELLTLRLASHGVPFRTVPLPYARHAFDLVWNGWSAQVLRPILLDFLRTHT